MLLMETILMQVFVLQMTKHSDIIEKILKKTWCFLLKLYKNTDCKILAIYKYIQIRKATR